MKLPLNMQDCMCPELRLAVNLATRIGGSDVVGHPRFGFWSVELMGGVSFIPAMIGGVAISQVLRYVASNREVVSVPPQPAGHVFNALGRPDHQS